MGDPAVTIADDKSEELAVAICEALHDDELRTSQDICARAEVRLGRFVLRAKVIATLSDLLEDEMVERKIDVSSGMQVTTYSWRWDDSMRSIGGAA